MPRLSTKLKILTLVLLASVFGFLLLGKKTSAPTVRESIESQREALVSTRKETVWPEFELEEIALLKPFQTLKQLEQLRVAEGLSDSQGASESTSAPPEQPIDTSTVRAIFQTTRGTSALIGDQVFRVGDALPNGKRIVAIRPDGVEIDGD